MITASDLTGTDEKIATRTLIYARTSIAPRLNLLTGQDRDDAIAILTGVALAAAARAPRDLASQSVGTARIAYRDAGSWFTDEDKNALVALAGYPVGATGHPVGVFPGASRLVERIFGEEER